ncbi:bifunctional diguanylate cyclase/phosphodiesterase [Aurantimonas sp. VKM B-3413]|uniref:putative bifunctional diguanylate cyclase/phosphodiesterase n=1 Tax=Aurantimonas sp. VKM B-3413 TaxID=2779401 RepID=UPI001E3898E3|nr:EAL domain-containing protein [Aurantimonas sp. VKM B-3413]MCB8838810.1 EAL domain-containing protein [Aurantimonas sp. VKM B-3413]
MPMPAQPARNFPPRVDLFRTALSRIQTPVILADREDRIIFANRPAEKLLGRHIVDEPLSALLADPMFDVSTVDTVGAAPQWVRTAMAGVVPATIEALDGEGYLITVRESAAVAHAADRQPADELTGLPRRRELIARLKGALADARRSHARLAVHCLDLDRFKFVNDTLGHPIGDALLKKVVQRIVGACRKDDLVARVGGDEFVILQTEIDGQEAAEALSRRLVDLVSRTYLLDGHTVNIGVSIGIALSDGDATPEALLRQGDLALYQAKSGGRGRFAVFEPSMDSVMQERRQLEIDLRRALALREFELVYQPQFDLAESRPVGFEALLRWNHPRRGRVSPLAFIPLAEETGLITQIGEWVIRTACRQASTWPSGLSVSVNVSAVQFRAGSLVETVVSALAQSGLAPYRLDLEITESALMDDTEAVLATLNRLRGLGVQISMDDFGTGYSSLSYLHKFPFDKLKIDQSFVRGDGAGAGSGAILRAITGIGSSLGMKTTAEGVETEEQLRRIRSEGCTQVQGYLTGRPMPADTISDYLDRHPWDDVTA